MKLLRLWFIYHTKKKFGHRQVERKDDAYTEAP